MTIKAGDKIPSATLMEMQDGKPTPVSTDTFFAGKKVGDAVPVKVDAADVELRAAIRVMDQKTADAEEKADAEKAAKAPKAQDSK